MISKKIYNGDGSTSRFLSDFIIKTEQFARPYVFIYDDTLTADELQDDTKPWSYPDNLWKRADYIPNPAEDTINVDDWALVDNSIEFYSEPISGSTVWIEVATTSEEFGDSLVSESVESAINAATEANESAGNALSSEVSSALSADEALSSENNSAASAAAALISENESATSADEALVSRNASGVYSAASAASAAAALVSENNASDSATLSGEAAGYAYNSRVAAEASAAAALISEQNADVSEANAAQSAIDAEIAAGSVLHIERGVSGSWSYEKFSNGLLIVRAYKSLGTISCNVASGNLYRTADLALEDYPASFPAFVGDKSDTYAVTGYDTAGSPVWSGRVDQGYDKFCIFNIRSIDLLGVEINLNISGSWE